MSRYSIKFKRWLFSDKVQGELRSSYSIFIAQLLADGLVQLLDVYNGNFSQSAVMALLTVCIRSMVKTFFIKVKIVPAKTTSAGQGSVSVQMTKGIDRVIVKK